MDGRDGRIPQFDKNMFLITPDAMDSGGNGTPPPPMPDISKNLGIQTGVNNGLSYNLRRKATAIDSKFGAGASKWLTDNHNQFSPEEKMQLYYMTERMPVTDAPPGSLNRINGNMVAPDPNAQPVRWIQPTIGTRG